VDLLHRRTLNVTSEAWLYLWGMFLRARAVDAQHVWLMLTHDLFA
jgi:hypothetical protein